MDSKQRKIKSTPWDERSLNVKTYELNEVSETVLQSILGRDAPGHYTARIDPLDLAAHQILHHYGFYYCDTLIQPYCGSGDITYFEHPSVAVTPANSLESLLNICHGAFSYGRFHRDFNVSQENAHLRYDKWLEELFHSGHVWNLNYRNETVGFWGFSESQILLHAIKHEYRGKKISKYLWSSACRKMFDSGCREIESSISASNMPALNLYISLGFRIRSPKDVYHLLMDLA